MTTLDGGTGLSMAIVSQQNPRVMGLVDQATYSSFPYSDDDQCGTLQNGSRNGFLLEEALLNKDIGIIIESSIPMQSI